MWSSGQISKTYSFDRAMASKDTPKKLYKIQESKANISRCRLCYCVSDPKHSKNLFRSQNQAILRNAQIIYGGELPQGSDLPRQICAPCERRLNNAMQLRKIITETQQKLRENVRAKRCVEISPSVLPSAKVRAAGTSTRRRSIDFSIAAEKPQHPVSVHEILKLLMSFNIFNSFSI